MHGIRSVGSPASKSRLRVLRYQQCRGLIAGKCVVFSCCSVCVIFAICFCFTGQSRTVQEYVRVRVQSPAYIGYSPADDLSVDFRRMGFFVSDSFGGVLPNKVYATLEIRAS